MGTGRVQAKIDIRNAKYERKLRLYLLLNVIERVGAVDGEANKDNVGVGITERTETIVVFLAGGIPKCELDTLAINFDVCDVVLKYGRDIDLLSNSEGSAMFERQERSYFGQGRVAPMYVWWTCAAIWNIEVMLGTAESRPPAQMI